MSINDIEKLSDYGVKTIIIAILATIVYLACDKFLKEKLKTFKNYVALVVAVALEVAFDVIFITKEFVINTDCIYSGVITGSLATALGVFIKKIKNKKPVSFSATRLTIEGLLDGIVPCENKEGVAMLIENVYTENKDKLSGAELSLEINNRINKTFGLSISEQTVLIIITQLLKIKNAKK